MTSRTWTNGHWSLSGPPQPGDSLTLVTGTLEIGGHLAGDTLHLQDPTPGAGQVILDLNGNARVAIDGTLAPGDPLVVNVAGTDWLNATRGVDVAGGQSAGSINLAATAHLFVTGSMHFGYGGSLTGGAGSVLTNNALLALGSSNASPGKDGTVSGVAINGTGVLQFTGYHSAHGFASIASPIAVGQTIELAPEFYGLTMTLGDPGDFHGLLKIDPPRGSGDVSVVVTGVTADSYSVHGNQVMLTNGGRAVDLLRVSHAGSMSITPTFAPDATTLAFHVT